MNFTGRVDQAWQEDDQQRGTAGRLQRRSEDGRGWPAAMGEGEALGRVNADVEVTVILPAYNEAAALPQVLTAVFAVLDESCQVIVVDDGSTDATAAIARQFPCLLLQHKHNYGKGMAVRTGLRQARGRFIIIMDADNTYPAEALPGLIALSRDYDFVRCVRRNGGPNSPLINRFGNRLFDLMLRVVHGLEGGDYLSGLYGLRREALEAMHLTAARFDLEIEIAIKARARRLRSVTLPISYRARLGEKKLDAWSDGWAILHQIILMALLYSPGLMFVLPGVFIWSLASTLMLILSQGSIVTPYVGRLDVNSFIVAALGATVGFQFVVFGIAASLFGVEQGVRPKRWLMAASNGRVRLWAAVIGTICAMVGTVKLVATAGQWLLSGGGTFHNTRGLVLSGVLLSWGLQVVLAALFISIFAGKLARDRRGVPLGELRMEDLDLRAERQSLPVDSRVRLGEGLDRTARSDEWSTGVARTDRSDPVP